MNEEQIKDLIQEMIDNDNQVNQFGVSQTPYHTHNGSDSSRIPMINLRDKYQIISYTIPGTGAATAANYSTFFTAPFPLTIKQITEVHAVLGTDGGTVTVDVEKLTGTQAPGAGVVLTTTPFNLKSTINTVVTGILTSVEGAIQLNQGDRLALKDTGTLTSVENVTITIIINF